MMSQLLEQMKEGSIIEPFNGPFEDTSNVFTTQENHQYTYEEEACPTSPTLKRKDRSDDEKDTDRLFQIKRMRSGIQNLELIPKASLSVSTSLPVS